MKRINALRCALALAALVVAIVPGPALGAPPSNDDFVNAEVIDGRFGWIYGENTDATKEPGEPNHAGNPGGASVWYSWTAPSTGRATLNLCYAEFDSLLAVYTGDVVSALKRSRRTTTDARRRASSASRPPRGRRIGSQLTAPTAPRGTTSSAGGSPRRTTTSPRPFRSPVTPARWRRQLVCDRGDR